MTTEDPINQGAPGDEPPLYEDGDDSTFSADRATTVVDQHPEVLVGAAFVGGLVLAQILKRFGE
jgi:hypothetical protein